MFPSSKRPPALGTPGQKAAKAPVSEVEEVEIAAPEPDGDEIPPNPTALGFRTESETCGACSYMEGDSCSHPLIAQQVAAGDSCAAFEAKDDGVADYDAGGMDLEGSESTE